MARVYRQLPVYEDTGAVRALLEQGSRQELLTLPLAAAQSPLDAEFVQDLCLQLAASGDAEVRANACLGLAYIARIAGRLDRARVEPVLLHELREQVEFRWRIEDAIEDIELYLDWAINREPAN